MESAVVAALVVSDLFVSSDCKLNLSIWGILILNSKSDQEVKLEEALVINEHNSLTLQVRKQAHGGKELPEIHPTGSTAET